MCFLPSAGISARIFAKWLELPTLNEINDLIETGFVQTTKRRTLSVSNDSGTELSIKDKKHFKRAFKIYEKIWADEPEMIKAKYQEIQELYPQIGFS